MSERITPEQVRALALFIRTTLTGSGPKTDPDWLDRLAAQMSQDAAKLACRLSVDNPCLPPTDYEREQCRCQDCLKDLLKHAEAKLAEVERERDTAEQVSQFRLDEIKRLDKVLHAAQMKLARRDTEDLDSVARILPERWYGDPQAFVTWRQVLEGFDNACKDAEAMREGFAREVTRRQEVEAELARLNRQRDDLWADRKQLRVDCHDLRDRVAALKAQVANWERKEVQRGSCCADNEARVKGLETALERLLILVNPDLADGFLKNASVCTSQYDSLCRALASEILRLRDGLSAALAGPVSPKADTLTDAEHVLDFVHSGAVSNPPMAGPVSPSPTAEGEV
jgi:hypothetical protein